MLKSKSVKLLITSLFSVALVAGTAISVVSCGTSNSVAQTDEIVDTQLKNILEDKSAQTGIPVGGYDSSLTRGKFFSSLFSSLFTINSTTNAKEFIVNNGNGTFTLNRDKLIKVLESTSNLKLNQLTDDHLLELNKYIKKYEQEFNSYLKTNGSSVFPSESDLSLELNISKDMNNQIIMNGTFRSNVSFSTIEQAVESQISDSEKLAYDSEGYFIPQEKLSEDKFEDEVVMPEDVGTFNYPKVHPILAKTVLGYSEWSDPTYYPSKETWKVGTKIKVTFSAKWKYQNGLQPPANENLVFERFFILIQQRQKTLAYEKLKNLFNGKTEDGLKNLTSCQKANITGNFVWEILNKIQETKASRVQFSRQETINILKTALGLNQDTLNNLNEDEVSTLNENFLSFKVKNGILEKLQQIGHLAGLNVKVTLDIARDLNNKKGFLIKIEKNSDSKEDSVSKAVDYLSKLSDSLIYLIIHRDLNLSLNLDASILDKIKPYYVKDNKIYLSEEYLANNKEKFKKITGTKLAAVLGVNQYTSTAQMWAEIVGIYKEKIEDLTNINAGINIEPAVRNYVEAQLGTKYKFYDPEAIGYDVFKENKYFGGIPDGEPMDDKGNLAYDKDYPLLEIKTTSRHKHLYKYVNGALVLQKNADGTPIVSKQDGKMNEWFPNGLDGAAVLPIEYQMQIKLYMYLRNVTKGAIAVTFLEPEDYINDSKSYDSSKRITKIINIDFNRQEFETKVQEATKWYEDLVLKGVSPTLSKADLGDWVKYGLLDCV